MTARLKDKVAVVTAAGQGIGRAIAEAFIREGALVIASDLEAGKLEGLAAKKCVKLDVRSTPEVEALAQAIVKEFGAPHILVNCAGYVHDGTVLQCEEKDWDFSFDLNVKSMHRTIRAFLPAMVAAGRGSIVNMSSSARASGRTRSAPAPSIRLRSTAASRRRPRRPKNRKQRCARLLSTVSPWDGSARPRRWRRSRFSSPRTSRATSPVRRIWSTAAWRCSDAARASSRFCA